MLSTSPSAIRFEPWVDLGPDGGGLDDEGPEEDPSGELTQNPPKPQGFVKAALGRLKEYAKKALGKKTTWLLQQATRGNGTTRGG